jgi:hypothetical protein
MVPTSHRASIVIASPMKSASVAKISPKNDQTKGANPNDHERLPERRWVPVAEPGGAHAEAEDGKGDDAGPVVTKQWPRPRL